METNYNVDYFIKKFTNSRDDKWCVQRFQDNGRSCALGWCGMKDEHMTPEAISLERLMRKNTDSNILKPYGYDTVTAFINNGEHDNYHQPTPKQRILAALRDIKKMQGLQNTVSSEQKAQECDATEVDSSTQVGETTLYPDLTKSLAVLPEEKKEVDILLVTP